MRLSERERSAIVSAVHRCDPHASVWLFGSRSKDERRGGDIDIAVLSSRIDRREARKIRRAICDEIGEQKIDIVVARDQADPFFALATSNGKRIGGQEQVS